MLGLLLLVCIHLLSQDSARIESFFRSLSTYHQLNGSALLAQDGKLIYKYSFGWANQETNVLNNDSTRFSIGSVAKIFTATAILQLREKGKLKLDDKVSKFLPDFPYANITIRHLLSHTSGLPDYELFEPQVDQHPEKIVTNADFMPALKAWKKPLYFTPGDKWQYANTNFILLAILVERIGRQPFKAYIRQHIFLPSGMFDTDLRPGTNANKDFHKAVNYQYATLFAETPIPADSIAKLQWRTHSLSGFEGQGNIQTTTTDLLKFDEALESGRLLHAISLQEAYTPSKLNNGQLAESGMSLGKAYYGLGWFILADSSHGKIAWHGGGQPGAVAIFLRNLSKKQVVVLLDNYFSEGIYRNGWNAMQLMNGQVVNTTRQSLSGEYGHTLVKDGPDIAFCRLLQMRADSIHYYLDEDQQNKLGYQLMYEAGFGNHLKLALEVFRTNILCFPGSFNAYDSYAEALLNSGFKAEAIQLYHKALEINPGNPESINALKKIETGQ